MVKKSLVLLQPQITNKQRKEQENIYKQRKWNPISPRRDKQLRYLSAREDVSRLGRDWSLHEEPTTSGIRLLGLDLAKTVAFRKSQKKSTTQDTTFCVVHHSISQDDETNKEGRCHWQIRYEVCHESSKITRAHYKMPARMYRLYGGILEWTLRDHSIPAASLSAHFDFNHWGPVTH